MARQQRQTLVMVGNGPAGCRVLEEIVARDPERYTIVVFGDEPVLSYDRPQLAAVLAGARQANELLLRPAAWYEQYAIRLHTGVRVEQINRRHRQVLGRPVHSRGSQAFALSEPYDKL